MRQMAAQDVVGLSTKQKRCWPSRRYVYNSSKRNQSFIKKINTSKYFRYGTKPAFHVHLAEDRWILFWLATGQTEKFIVNHVTGSILDPRGNYAFNYLL